MSAVLRHLRTLNWRSLVPSVVRGGVNGRRGTQPVASWKRLGSAQGQGIFLSLFIHLVLVFSAALALMPTGQTQPPRLALTVTDPEWLDRTNDQAFSLTSEVSEFELPAGAGLQGESIIAIAREPIVSEPTAATVSLWDLVDDGVASSVLSQAAKPISERSRGRGAGGGAGDGIGAGTGTGRQFFGMASEGKRFVYVLDCSLSMNHPHDSAAKTRLQRLKQELARSISQLKPDQEFFIIFFNHETIPMPANQPVAAVAENQQQFLAWVQDIPAIGDTDPTGALALALRMQPDVIYFLTDGSFSQPANDIVNAIRQPKTQIHTFSFATQLTDKQLAGLELMRSGKMSAARQKLGENTYRRVRDLFIGEQVLKRLSERNSGQFQMIP